MTIGSSFGLITPKGVKEETFEKATKSFLQYSGLDDKEKALTKMWGHVFDVPTLVGIEIEVENITVNIPVVEPVWTVTVDPSLRNNGKELKSAPLTPKQAVISLSTLWQTLYKVCKPDFSWRTSIHFHLNVCDLDKEELQKMLLLSLIFEDLFFTFVGQDRDQSIFCVPLRQSTQMNLIRSFLKGKKSVGEISGEKWHKYSAVNLFRLQDLGTVEFRHMGGTDSILKITTWLVLLLQLYRASVKMPSSVIRDWIMELNTSSKYWEFVCEVFSPEVTNKLQINDWQTIMDKTISKAKDFFVDPIKFGEVKEGSALAKQVEKVMKERETEDNTRELKKAASAKFELDLAAAAIKAKVKKPNPQF